MISTLLDEYGLKPLDIKLSRLADGLIEAAWLAAVLLTPVFFNIYSSRIFEPDKIALLRSLALVIIAAWLVKSLGKGSLRLPSKEEVKTAFRRWWRTPILLPVGLMLLVVCLSTLFSLNPRVSLLGSYQRLQGAYTTLSYLVILTAILAHLRRKEQIDRLVLTIILGSLPVSLYGVLQRYGLDPIPWGGNVQERIAANMGNSIFVAAYFIMVFPLTFMRMVDAFEAMLQEEGFSIAHFSRATIYVFIACLQLAALYFTGSRGPWLGWGASMVFLWLGFSLIWKKRWLTFSGVAVAQLVAVFLILLNVAGGAFEQLRARPEFQRLGQLLDVESRTGKVRTLIWTGAAELVMPHAPLEFPDGRKDALNGVRWMLGYGPESMYVAYNPFYPPELTLVEQRNASPDRSHNETWDVLVTMGLPGLIAYLWLFGAVLYYGLKWLGLVPGTAQRNLFLGLYLAGGVVSTVVFLLWKGLPFLGVALPFGMVAGVLVYLLIVSLQGRYTAPADAASRMRAYLLLGLLAAIVAHFVEINFGIAIAVTRTYFWMYTALLIVVGYSASEGFGVFTPGVDSPQESPASQPVEAGGRRVKTSTRRVRSSARHRRGSSALRRWEFSSIQKWSTELRGALILGLLLATLGFDFFTTASKATSAWGIIGDSLFKISATEQATRNGIFSIILITWLCGALLWASEGWRSTATNAGEARQRWSRAAGMVGIGALSLAGLFWLWHANQLAWLIKTSVTNVAQVLEQVERSQGLITGFYVMVLVFLSAMGILAMAGGSANSKPGSSARRWIALGCALIVCLLVVFSNLHVIQADIAFKTAELFTQPNSWPVAIEIYHRAIDLAPNEDYYYLFLGRAYLEHAKTFADETERDGFMAASANDLRTAQEINPLNPDHTANLARLYSLWASFTTDADLREQRTRVSDEYFSRALVLSPRNARLWDEWALLYINLKPLPEEAQWRLEKSLEIDPYYDWSYALMGELYMRFGGLQAGEESELRMQALNTALSYFKKAYDLAGENISMKMNYALAIANVQNQIGNTNEAIATLSEAILLDPTNTERWRLEFNIARLYAQIGDLQKALEHAQIALSLAPEEGKTAIQQEITDWLAP